MDRLSPFLRPLRTILKITFALYIAALGYIYLTQQSLEYHPHHGRDLPQQIGLTNIAVLHLQASDGQKLVAWYRKPEPDHPTILYFHGNLGDLSDLKKRITLLTNAGNGLLAVDYRGFGASEGKIDEPGLLLDAEAAYESLLSREVGLKHIIIYGHSLGSGVAVALASHHKVAALVLEAPFSSAVDVAAALYWEFPVRILMRDQFRSDLRIQKVTSPILILHGTSDVTVPYHFGKRLFELAPEPKSLITIADGQHELLLEPGVNEKVQEWLSAHVPLAPNDPSGTGMMTTDDQE